MATKLITVNINDLKETEHNPRQITKKEFEKLKKSLQEDPEFLEAREIVVDENLTILGGHQRIKALKDMGKKEVEVKQVIGWSKEKKRRFVIKDNIQNGEWDMDELANSWSELPLDDWGIDADSFEMLDDTFKELEEGENFVMTIKSDDSNKLDRFLSEISSILERYNLRANIK